MISIKKFETGISEDKRLARIDSGHYVIQLKYEMGMLNYRGIR